MLKILEQYRKDILLFLVSFLAVFILFLFNHRYEFAENEIFQNYALSLINDFDFNVFNQYTKQEHKWLVTSTFNHADFHSPFYSALISPFVYIFTHLSKLFNNQEAIRTFFFGVYFFLNISIVYFISTLNFFKDKVLEFFIFIFSSSFLWFFLFDNTDSSHLLMLITTIVFSLLIKGYDQLSKRDLHIIAALLVIFCLCNPSGAIWLIPISFYFLLKKDLHYFKYLFAWGIPLLLCLIITNYVRFEQFYVGNPLVEIGFRFVHLKLIGPNGIFVKSPIIILSTLGLIIAWKNEKNEIITLGFGILLFKLFVLNFFRSPNLDDVGNRLFLTEFPIFLYGFCFLISKMKLHLRISILIPLVILNLLGTVSILYHYQYSSEFDYRLSYLGFFESYNLKPSLFYYYINDNLKFIKGNFFQIFLIGIISGTFIFSFRKLLKKIENKKQVLLIIPAFLITTSTILNLVNNKDNVEKMKNLGIFDNTVSVKGDAIYYDEVVGLIHYMKIQNKRINYGIEKDLKIFRDNYISDFEKNIIVDSIGITDDLKAKKVRESFWQKY